MQSRRMVTMHHERVSCSRDFYWRRLGCFVEISFPGIVFKLFWCFVRPGSCELFWWGLGHLLFRMDSCCKSQNSLPGISVLSDALGNFKEIKLPGTFKGIQFFPMQRRRDCRAGKSANTVGRNNSLRLAVAVDIEEYFAFPVLFLDLQGHYIRV